MVLPTVISKDQTGFIKGRHSYFNVPRLLNIVYSCSVDSTGCVVFLDAEKAFDRVEFEYIFAVLDRFSFGAKFTAWNKLLYSQPSATIRTNSQMSMPFKLHRGTCQGCTLSPLIFDPIIEPLAITLASKKYLEKQHRTQGCFMQMISYFLFPSHQPCYLLYWVCLVNLVSFPGKSELFPLSSKASMLDFTNLPYRVERQKFIHWGITVTKKHKNLFKDNLIKLLNQVKQSLTQWTPLYMSLVGCINSIKMTILPKFYTFSRHYPF